MTRNFIWFLVYFSIGLAVVVDVHRRMDRELPKDGELIMTILVWPVFPVIAALAYVFPHKQR